MQKAGLARLFLFMKIKVLGIGNILLRNEGVRAAFYHRTSNVDTLLPPTTSSRCGTRPRTVMTPNPGVT
ncbi:MAG: hypothetical protein AMJ45_02140 [Syntrophobacter sp. DG_60]|nr:MAG: hypothetical protein AMJ45_02140 [Syntrophobacter sp. DG_60]